MGRPAKVRLPRKKPVLCEVRHQEIALTIERLEGRLSSQMEIGLIADISDGLAKRTIRELIEAGVVSYQGTYRNKPGVFLVVKPLPSIGEILIAQANSHTG